MSTVSIQENPHLLYLNAVQVNETDCGLLTIFSLWFKFLKDIKNKNNGPQWDLAHLTFIYSETLNKLIKGTYDQPSRKLNQNGHIKIYLRAGNMAQ